MNDDAEVCQVLVAGVAPVGDLQVGGSWQGPVVVFSQASSGVVGAVVDDGSAAVDALAHQGGERAQMVLIAVVEDFRAGGAAGRDRLHHHRAAGKVVQFLCCAVGKNRLLVVALVV